MFAVRIVTADHYLAPPIEDLDVTYSDFRCSEIKQVPVIRIFGSTPSGQKTCLHMHNVFPYICVPFDSLEPWEKYSYQLAVGLDRALNTSMGNHQGTKQHVFKVVLISGVPFYGYHASERQFLKIYFYNPAVIKKAGELLQNGAVMNHMFQPHEAHIPYVLQMFIDYSLCGMSFLHLNSIKFRRHKEDSTEDVTLSGMSKNLSECSQDTQDPNAMIWNSHNIPSNLLLPKAVCRQSTCELEVDAQASDILVHNELDESCMNPGLRGIWEDERQRRRNLGIESQVSCASSQDRDNVPSDSEIKHLQKLRDILKKRLSVLNISQHSSKTASPKFDEVHNNNSNAFKLTPNAASPSQAHPSATPVNTTLTPNGSSPVNQEMAFSLTSNQSLTESKGYSDILDTQDESIVQLLAKDWISEKAAPAEEADSILYSQDTVTSHHKGDGDNLDDAAETWEMSQPVWDSDFLNDSAFIREMNECNKDSSQCGREAENEILSIPQLDGPIDSRSLSKEESASTSVGKWNTRTEIIRNLRLSRLSRAKASVQDKGSDQDALLPDVPALVHKYASKESSVKNVTKENISDAHKYKDRRKPFSSSEGVRTDFKSIENASLGPAKEIEKARLQLSTLPSPESSAGSARRRGRPPRCLSLGTRCKGQDKLSKVVQPLGDYEVEKEMRRSLRKRAPYRCLSLKTSSGERGIVKSPVACMMPPHELSLAALTSSSNESPKSCHLLSKRNKDIDSDKATFSSDDLSSCKTSPASFESTPSKKTCHSVGTNVRPRDFLHFQHKNFYIIKYGSLRVNIPTFVKTTELRKLGKERLCLQKLTDNCILNCNKNAIVDLDKSVGKHLIPEAPKQIIRLKRTPQHWSLQSQSQSGLKIRLKAPGAKSDEFSIVNSGLNSEGNAMPRNETKDMHCHDINSFPVTKPLQSKKKIQNKIFDVNRSNQGNTRNKMTRLTKKKRGVNFKSSPVSPVEESSSKSETLSPTPLRNCNNLILKSLNKDNMVLKISRESAVESIVRMTRSKSRREMCEPHLDFRDGQGREPISSKDYFITATESSSPEQRNNDTSDPLGRKNEAHGACSSALNFSPNDLNLASVKDAPLGQQFNAKTSKSRKKNPLCVKQQSGKRRRRSFKQKVSPLKFVKNLTDSLPFALEEQNKEKLYGSTPSKKHKFPELRVVITPLPKKYFHLQVGAVKDVSEKHLDKDLTSTDALWNMAFPSPDFHLNANIKKPASIEIWSPTSSTHDWISAGMSDKESSNLKLKLRKLSNDGSSLRVTRSRDPLKRRRLSQSFEDSCDSVFEKSPLIYRNVDVSELHSSDSELSLDDKNNCKAINDCRKSLTFDGIIKSMEESPPINSAKDEKKKFEVCSDFELLSDTDEELISDDKLAADNEKESDPPKLEDSDVGEVEESLVLSELSDDDSSCFQELVKTPDLALNGLVEFPNSNASCQAQKEMSDASLAAAAADKNVIDSQLAWEDSKDEKVVEDDDKSNATQDLKSIGFGDNESVNSLNDILSSSITATADSVTEAERETGSDCGPSENCDSNGKNASSKLGSGNIYMTLLESSQDLFSSLTLSPRPQTVTETNNWENISSDENDENQHSQILIDSPFKQEQGLPSFQTGPTEYSSSLVNFLRQENKVRCLKLEIKTERPESLGESSSNSLKEMSTTIIDKQPNSTEHDELILHNELSGQGINSKKEMCPSLKSALGNNSNVNGNLVLFSQSLSDNQSCIKVDPSLKDQNDQKTTSTPTFRPLSRLFDASYLADLESSLNESDKNQLSSPSVDESGSLCDVTNDSLNANEMNDLVDSQNSDSLIESVFQEGKKGKISNSSSVTKNEVVTEQIEISERHVGELDMESESSDLLESEIPNNQESKIRHLDPSTPNDIQCSWTSSPRSEENIQETDYVADEETKQAVDNLLSITNSEDKPEDLRDGNTDLWVTKSDTALKSLDQETKCEVNSQELTKLDPIVPKNVEDVSKQTVFKFISAPPSRTEILQTAPFLGILENIHKEAFCSNVKDIPEKSSNHLVQKLRQASGHLQDLQEFEGKFQVNGLENWRVILATHFGNGLLNSSNSDMLKQLKSSAHVRAALAPQDKGVVIMTPNVPPPKRSVIKKEGVLHPKLETVSCKSVPQDKTYQKSEEKKTPENDKIAFRKQASAHQLAKTKTNHAQIVLANSNLPVIEEESEYLQTDESSIENQTSPSCDVANFSPDVFNDRVNHNRLKVKVGPQHSTPVIHACTMPSPTVTPILNTCHQNNGLSKRKLLDLKGKARSKLSIRVVKKLKLGTSNFVEADDENGTLELENHKDLHHDEMECVDETGNEVLFRSSKPRESKTSSPSEKPQISDRSMNATDCTTSCGYKRSCENLQEAKTRLECQFLTTLTVELHIQTREDLRPDPEQDPVLALFYHIHKDGKVIGGNEESITGTIIVDSSQAKLQDTCSCSQKTFENIKEFPFLRHQEKPFEGAQDHVKAKVCCQCRNMKRSLLAKTGDFELEVLYVPNENTLFEQFSHLMQKLDPDILVGYEVQMLSWGYMLQRGAILGFDMDANLSRIPTSSKKNIDLGKNEDDYSCLSEVYLVGRIVINLWRLMRSEAALTSYTFENVVYHILHRRIPSFSFRTLTDWFSCSLDQRWRVVEYYVFRVKGAMTLIKQLDIIGRTSELARLFGIQFFEVLSRGSQFRVESMMLRLTRFFKYIAVSPSIEQRARMRAPECLPLIMEPESRFYSSPVLVLDFQSLYPSMIIAYNYCFSTCLGRVECLAEFEPFDFGCTSLGMPPDLQKSLIDEKITVSPVGVAFVKSSVRQGILPRMLSEILETRIMVKNVMKKCKDNKALYHVLNAQQLGLKLIANVTYGYTSANFSGRMPCVEVADSIVSKARETLERAIKLVLDHKEWNAKIVYGDTDSMFVHLPGQSKEDAFRIGQEIVAAVTADNPKPVKLKLEKVYMPCVLQTKKRYVGYMYETPDQKEPILDAKGIETIRRDGCPAVVKTLEKSLKILFTSRDISQVKKYVQKQFQKFLQGDVNLHDCIFAREYRGLHGYKPGACVPALEITKRLLKKDRRAEPRAGERVPYVIVYGSPGEPLFHLVKQPDEVLLDPSLRLNAHYYINNVITPPLQRIFCLIGIDVKTWYTSLSRAANHHSSIRISNMGDKKATISQYFCSSTCPACSEYSPQGGICSECQKDLQSTIVILSERISEVEKSYCQLKQICCSCTGIQDKELRCISLDCPNLYQLAQVSSKMQQVPSLRTSYTSLLEF